MQMGESCHKGFIIHRVFTLERRVILNRLDCWRLIIKDMVGYKFGLVYITTSLISISNK